MSDASLYERVRAFLETEKPHGYKCIIAAYECEICGEILPPEDAAMVQHNTECSWEHPKGATND